MKNQNYKLGDSFSVNESKPGVDGNASIYMAKKNIKNQSIPKYINKNKVGQNSQSPSS